MDPLPEAKTIYKDAYPYLLQQLEKLPASLDIIGTMPPETHRYLCVVGSRTHSPYGREACEKLIAGLAGYPIVIVSGLAVGLDTIAHEAALEAGLTTVAFPGSGLGPGYLYPPSRLPLAKRIIHAGGGLISSFKPEWSGQSWMFPVRNVLMAGMSHATLIIEGVAGSGTISTARAAVNNDREVLIVPGSIFSELSTTPLDFLKEGAHPVTCSKDILDVLGLNAMNAGINGSLFNNQPNNDARTKATSLAELWSITAEERAILDHIKAPISRDDLIRKLGRPVSDVNAVLNELELKLVIVERQGLLMRN